MNHNEHNGHNENQESKTPGLLTNTFLFKLFLLLVVPVVVNRF